MAPSHPPVRHAVWKRVCPRRVPLFQRYGTYWRGRGHRSLERFVAGGGCVARVPAYVLGTRPQVGVRRLLLVGANALMPRRGRVLLVLVGTLFAWSACASRASGGRPYSAWTVTVLGDTSDPRFVAV